MVGVKLDKQKDVGFFETIMKLDKVRNKHKTQGSVLAIEFDDVKASDDTLILTIPESKDRFMLKVKDGNIALESNYFKKLAAG